ncbi:MAG: DnaD domain protein, partial [Clostridia bacterium]|nr:DnaD domain protein [Clostridia bacterium]
IEKYEKWKQKYGQDMVFCAAEMAAGTNMPMRYMARLLMEWDKAGVKTPEEAKARKAQTAAPQPQNYQQREYKEADYGKDFFYDPAADYTNGGEGK